MLAETSAQRISLVSDVRAAVFKSGSSPAGAVPGLAAHRNQARVFAGTQSQIRVH